MLSIFSINGSLTYAASSPRRRVRRFLRRPAPDDHNDRNKADAPYSLGGVFSELRATTSQAKPPLTRRTAVAAKTAQLRLVVTAKLADTADAAACPTSARREAAIFGKCPFLGFDAHTTLGGDLPPSVGRQLGKPT